MDISTLEPKVAGINSASDQGGETQPAASLDYGSDTSESVFGQKKRKQKKSESDPSRGHQKKRISILSGSGFSPGILEQREWLRQDGAPLAERPEVIIDLSKEAAEEAAPSITTYADMSSGVEGGAAPSATTDEKTAYDVSPDSSNEGLDRSNSTNCDYDSNSNPPPSSGQREHPLLTSSVFGSDADELGDSKISRSERAEQSALVSQVARQLEAHIKRATEGYRKGGRRGGGALSKFGGTVTPPPLTDTMKYNALTYDDEIVVSEESDEFMELEKFTREKGGATVAKVDALGNVLVVTDGDDDSEDEALEAGQKTKKLGCGLKYEAGSEKKVKVSFSGDLTSEMETLPPVPDPATIAAVGRKLLDRLPGRDSPSSRENGHVAAAVAGFCMTTPPLDPDLPSKVLRLMCSCTPLAHEFLRYRFALDPNSSPLDALSTMSFHQQTIVLNNFLEGDSKKEETIRDFKVFMVNCLDELLGDATVNRFIGLRESEVSALRRSIATWSNSTAVP